MRRLNYTSWKNLGAAAAMVTAAGLLASTASAASLTLAQANAGPSSADIPGAASDKVATVVYPREIQDVTIVPDFGDFINLVDALEVEAAGGTGLRWRSVGLVPGNDATNGLGEMLVEAITDGFDATAADSFIIFLNDLTISTPADLADFIANGSAGDDFVMFFLDNGDLNGGAGYADADLEEADLDDGIIITQDELETATPDGGGTVDQYKEFSAAIVVFTDGAFDPGTNDFVLTEFLCVDNDGLTVAPVDAVFDTDDQTIRILPNQQLVDDFDGSNPADTDPGNLTVADFRVLTSGGATQTLANFLAALNDANTVATVDVLTDDDQNHRIIEIGLTNQVTDEADIATILGARVGFLGSDVDSVTGDNQNNATSSYQLMDRPGEIEVDSVELLQGNGPVIGEGSQREIWAVVTLSANITNVGDFDQFVLKNEDGDIVATSDDVTTATVTNTEVPGFEDADLNGTADDPVADEGDNVLFVLFLLDDSDDAINSDGTWSDEGSDDPSARDERQALTLCKNEFATDFASTDLGDEIADSTEVVVESLARPLAIQALTSAGATGDFCEFVDGVRIVFDCSVTGVDSTQFGLKFIGGETISDLTEGLATGQSIPTVDLTDPADYEDELLSASTLSLVSTYTSNDSVSANAPALPVDGEAADGSTSILAGTRDTPYAVGVNVNAVDSVASSLSNTATATFDDPDGGDMTGGDVEVDDGAPPAFMSAVIASDDGETVFDVQLGFSEDVNNTFGGDEVESFFFIMVNDSVGARINIEGADFDGFGFGADDNLVYIEGLSLELEQIEDPGLNFFMFSPGWTVEDDFGNAVNPLVTKEKPVAILEPSAEFKEEGCAFVDEDTDKVTRVVLQTTRQVTVAGGSLTDLLNRFVVRGDDFGFDGGEGGSLGGLLASIEISSTPRADGCFNFEILFMNGMPFPQEDFFIEYVPSSDDAELTAATLVDNETGNEVPGDSVYCFVARPTMPSPEGNPLGETFVGTVNLGGGDESPLGASVEAFVFKPLSSCGDITFTYKGILYTGEVEGLGDDDENLFSLTANTTTTRYFHPQLKDDGSCDGTLEPCGIVNSKPDLDIYQVATLSTTESGSGGNGGVNSSGGATFISTSSQALLYQNLDPSFVIKPIALTIRPDTTCPGRFTVTGTGISNGVLEFEGRFESIGTTYVTNVDSNNLGSYTLHTRGSKDCAGLPVVFVICPDDKFSLVEPFLGNNFVVRGVTFASDARFENTSANKSNTLANNAPMQVNFNVADFERFVLDDYEQDDWVILPVVRNNSTSSGQGQDFIRSGFTAPNRISTLTNNVASPVNTLVTLPSTNVPVGRDARGFFLALDVDDCEPELLDVDLALALDNRGVYCGSLKTLNRMVSGYAYALEVGSTGDLVWFNFGSRFTAGSLTVNSSATNGGWNLLAFLGNATIAPAAFGGDIQMTMNSDDGVRIAGVGTNFDDLEEINANDGVLSFSDANFSIAP